MLRWKSLLLTCRLFPQPDKGSMRPILAVTALMLLIACGGRSYRTYPDNSSIQYLDASAGAVGGNLDATGVTMHYKGPLKDAVESLGPVEGKVSKRGAKKADALRELQAEAQKKNADGVYDVLVEIDGETVTASGVAFRFKR